MSHGAWLRWLFQHAWEASTTTAPRGHTNRTCRCEAHPISPLQGLKHLGPEIEFPKSTNDGGYWWCEWSSWWWSMSYHLPLSINHLHQPALTIVVSHRWSVLSSTLRKYACQWIKHLEVKCLKPPISYYCCLSTLLITAWTIIKHWKSWFPSKQMKKWMFK